MSQSIFEDGFHRGIEAAARVSRQVSRNLRKRARHEIKTSAEEWAFAIAADTALECAKKIEGLRISRNGKDRI